MILLALAAVVLPCDGLATQQQQDACFIARQAFICWTSEHEHIDPADPAILLFWDKGESKRDAMIDLATERANIC